MKFSECQIKYLYSLSNFIIFPKTTVPLNIFEPRHIETNDAKKLNKMIGIIQPKMKTKTIFQIYMMLVVSKVVILETETFID